MGRLTPTAGRRLSPAFIAGRNRPIPGKNCGLRSGVSLTAYSGTGAGGTLTVSSPTTFSNVDFGTTIVKVNSSDVVFDNCRFTFTKTVTSHSTAGAPLDFRGGATYTGRVVRRCEIVNTSQYNPGSTGVIGYGFALDRCVVKGFTDGIGTYVPSSRPDADVDVQVRGTWIGELGWWWDQNDGVVHPSDNKTHNDGLQHQGGRGLIIEGCDIQGFYSATVGTGTPNSGSESVPAAPYTQAEGASARASIVNASGAGGLGGSIAGILFSSASRGLVWDCLIRKNWGGGGAYWLNDGVSENDGSTGFGTVTGNRIDPTQRINGWAFGIHTGTTATVVANYWSDGSGLITRRNA